MTEEQMKDWIDKASYEELLGKWRRESIGSPFFMGEVGEYFERKMNAKRSEITNEEHVKASKNIGWERVLRKEQYKPYRDPQEV